MYSYPVWVKWGEMSTFHCICQPIHTRLIPSSLSIYLFLSFSRNTQVVNYKLLPFQTTLMSFLPRCRENIAIHLHSYHRTYEKNSHSLPIFVVSRIIAFVQKRLVSVRFCLVYFFLCILLQWHRISIYPFWLWHVFISCLFLSLFWSCSIMWTHKIATISVLNEITKPHKTNKMLQTNADTEFRLQYNERLWLEQKRQSTIRRTNGYPCVELLRFNSYFCLSCV